MSKCYLLSVGSYSDYGVIAVFSTREDAEAVQVRHPDSEVEERELDPGIVHGRDGYYRFFVEMDRDTGDVYRDPYETYPDGDEQSTVVESGRRPPVGIPSGEWPPHRDWTPTLKISCWARDISHAVKIASEHRARLIASGEVPGEPT